jgi:hypothetical protein
MSSAELSTEGEKTKALIETVVSLHRSHHDVAWSDHIPGKEVRTIFTGWQENPPESASQAVMFLDITSEEGKFQRFFYQMSMNTAHQEFSLVPITNKDYLSGLFKDQLRRKEIVANEEVISDAIDVKSIYDIMLQMKPVDTIPEVSQIISLATDDKRAVELFQALNKAHPLLAGVISKTLDQSNPPEARRLLLLTRWIRQSK